MDEKKAATLEQLLESARQSEALTMQVAQAAQAEMEKLFTSVSDGKALIASAITDKGVSTATDASFQTMRENILAIGGSSMPEGVYQINVSASTAEGGTVSGGGVASEGMTLTVSANAADGYNFEGWQENGEVVSTDNTYTFTVTGNRTFVAGFAESAKEPTWEITTLPLSSFWVGVAYGNGKFVSVSRNSNKIAYSEDGVNWEYADLPKNYVFSGVEYLNGKFIAYGSSLSYSSDGINWTFVNSPNSLYGIAYGNGVYVAVTYGSYIYTSENLTDWDQKIINSVSYYTSIIFDSGKFVALTRTKSICSTNGIDWNVSDLPNDSYRNNIAYGNGKFVSVSNNSNKIVYSEDGFNWMESVLPFDSGCSWISYGSGMFVGVARNSANFAYSYDGVNWTIAALPLSADWRCVTCGNGKFVAVAYSSNKAAYTL